MKQILIFSCMLFLLCCKKGNDDFTGNYIISGTAYKTNPLTGDSSTLVGEKVYLKYDEQVNNDYLYYVITDAEGKFLFKNIDGDNKAPYVVFVRSNFMDTASEYYAEHIVNAGSFELQDNGVGREARVHLNASFDSTRQTGLSVFVRDEKGERVPAAAINIFFSENLAKLDTKDFAGTGAAHKLKADSAGRAFVSKIPPGTKVYINAHFKVGDVTMSSTMTTGTIEKGKVIPVVCTLTPPAPSAKPNVLLLKIIDHASGSVAAADVNIFYSQVAAIYDTTNFEGKGASFMRKSDSTGTVLISPVPYGKIYINAKFDFDSTTRIKTVLFEKTIILNDTTKLNVLLE